jgi:membrane protein implicated in regulation of membrane protease activity
MAAFVTAFGAFGLTFSQFEATRSPAISAGLSVIGAMAVSGMLVSVLGKLFHVSDSSSESQVATLVGHVATVISPIPAGAVGEIAYVQSGTRYTAPAREERGEAVPTGSQVKITRIIGSQFYVALDTLTTTPKNS